MEPQGIVDCTVKIWNSEKAWLHTFVSNDDSSSRAALKHSYKDKEHLDEPRNPKKKGKGKLPAEVREPEIYLVDPSHHHHVYGTHLYKLMAKCKALKKQLLKYLS